MESEQSLAVTLREQAALIRTLLSQNEMLAMRIEGIESFRGQSCHTARWPHEPVSFDGKRVAVIGSGPAGEKGAAQAAYFGKRVALVERSAEVGGALNDQNPV